MPNGDCTRAKVLVVHENPQIARLFGGILRIGFQVQVLTDCDNAMACLRASPPDLTLCDIGFFVGRPAQRVGLLEYLGMLHIPLILVTSERPEECVELFRLNLRAVDVVPQSVDPRLLRWKVTNWTALKREVDALRESDFRTRKQASLLESQMQMLLHDLKSPLIAARGFGKRLRKQLARISPDRKITDTLDCLDQTTDSMERLLRESTNALINGCCSNNCEPIRLDEIARDVIRQHQESLRDKGIKLETHFAGDAPPCVAGNRQQVREVLDNLLSNAVQHMGERPDASVVIRVVQNGQWVTTHVVDNGCGIAQDYHEKIFDRFFRISCAGDKNGSGLGLYIVKQIVESHHGKVWVESAPGKGATFSFTLPQFAPTAGT